MTRPLTLYLIAGEPSGDRLGAALMQGLRALEPDVRFVGVGGRAMAAEGLESLFDIIDLNVMGIVEVLPRLRLVLRRIRETVSDAARMAPDALITIDSPGFSLRVAKRLRARVPGVRTIHYVAPSVWAWRPGRAGHMARFVDHVLALLPFEPPYMRAAGMTCDFVGHPIAERVAPAPEAIAAFRAQAGGGGPVLLLAPGSRKGEIRRMMPVFSAVVARVRHAHPGMTVVIPVAETVVAEVAEAVAGMDPAPVLVLPEAGEAAKLTAIAAADVALVTSGTVTLEMAAAGAPMVAAYRASWLTSAIVRRLLKVDTVNLVNLIVGEKVVPEFLQERCTADRITPALLELMERGDDQDRQRVAFDQVMNDLGRGGEPPSARAARSVMAALNPV